MEDDMFVVIVGDDDSSDSTAVQVVENENSTLNEEIEINGIIDTVKKYGVNVESLNIKKEPLEDSEYHSEEFSAENIKKEAFYEYDYIEDEFIPFIKTENNEDYDLADSEYIELDNIPENSESADEDYIPQQEDWDEDEEEYMVTFDNKPKEKLRRKCLDKSEAHSYVKEMIAQRPELKKNKKLLISALVELMKSVRPPPTPKNAYKFFNLKYICMCCGAETISDPAAARHYQEYHGPRYLICYACGVDFRSKASLYRHEKKCKGEYVTEILKARSQFIGLKARNRPFLDMIEKKSVKTKPSSKRFHCSKCPASFATQQVLESHEHLHQGVRPYLCQQCPACYTSRTALARHTKKHRNDKFICDTCDRCFNMKEALVAHMDTHLPLKKFGCDQCDRRYSQKAALVLHIDRVHKLLPPAFPCNVCEKRYTKMWLLKKHMKREHGLIVISRKMYFSEMPKLIGTEVLNATVVKRSGSIQSEPSLEDEVDDYAKDLLEYAARVENEAKREQKESRKVNKKDEENFIYDVKQETVEDF